MKSLMIAATILLAAEIVQPSMYLPFPTQAEAEARSRAQCVQEGCEGLKWQVISVSGGRFALVIPPPLHKPSLPDPTGVTIYEWGRLKTAKQLGLED